MEVDDNDETVLSPPPRPTQIRSKAGRAIRELKKYPILPPCNSKCRFTCSENIDSGLRHEIWKKFRNGSFEERRSFLNANVNIVGVKRRKPTALDHGRRKHSMLYFLPKENGELIQVCKTMFLHTLGARTDGILKRFVEAKARSPAESIYPCKEKRGRKKSLYKSDSRQCY